MCICASTNPGTTHSPAASMTSWPSYAPSPAIQPSTIATSRVEPFAREDRQHAAAADHEVGRLVAARDRRDASRGNASTACENRTLRPVDVLTPRRSTRRCASRPITPRRSADPGRHRRDGRAQLRPRAPGGDAEPERGRASSAASRARTARCGSARALRTPRSSVESCATCCRRSPRRRARSGHRRSATAARSAATSAPRRLRATRSRRSSSKEQKSSAPRCAAFAASRCSTSSPA